MTSIRAHLLDGFLRLARVKQRARKATPQQARAELERFTPPGPKGVRYTPGNMGGVPGEWVETPAQKPFATLFYIHGGAYVAMSPRTHRALTGGLAQRGLRIFAVDYRLAPENPFPAALDDAFAAYEGLRQQTQGPLFVAGDSAGGGLSLALLLKLKDERRPLPAGAVLFSPWTDLAATGPSLVTNRNWDPLLPADSIPDTVRHYLGPGGDPKNPYASPLYGDYRGLPPLKFFVGSREILLDDSRRAYDKARAAGVEADIEIWPVVPHVWMIFPRLLPEAKQALNNAAAFMRKHAGTSAAR